MARPINYSWSPLFFFPDKETFFDLYNLPLSGTFHAPEPANCTRRGISMNTHTCTHSHTHTLNPKYSLGDSNLFHSVLKKPARPEKAWSPFNTPKSTAISHTDNTGICVKVHDMVHRGYLEWEAEECLFVFFLTGVSLMSWRSRG